MAGIDIGTLSLAKAFAGTSEVIKVILNGVTLYEKTTSQGVQTADGKRLITADGKRVILTEE